MSELLKNIPKEKNQSYKLGDVNVINIIGFDLSQSSLGQVLLLEKDKKIIEKQYKMGINPVLLPIWSDGKLIRFSIIPAEKAVYI